MYVLLSETGNRSLKGRAFPQTSGTSVTELKPEYGSTDICAGTWSSCCQPEVKAPDQKGDHRLPVSMEGSLPVHWLPEPLPGPGGEAAVLKQGPSSTPARSRSPSGQRVNSRGVILGWACGLGQVQDLLLMIFWGSGSWVLSGPPGKLQAYQVRNQINTPGGRSKKNSGFREPPHPARPNCRLSLPWHPGLFFGSQAPRNRTGLQGAQGDSDLCDQPLGAG